MSQRGLFHAANITAFQAACDGEWSYFSTTDGHGATRIGLHFDDHGFSRVIVGVKLCALETRPGWRNEVNQQCVAFRSAETYDPRSPAYHGPEGVSHRRRPSLLVCLQKCSSRSADAAPIAFWGASLPSGKRRPELSCGHRFAKPRVPRNAQQGPCERPHVLVRKIPVMQ